MTKLSKLLALIFFLLATAWLCLAVVSFSAGHRDYGAVEVAIGLVELALSLIFACQHE